MDPNGANQADAQPFRKVKGKHGAKFRQSHIGGETGLMLELEHDGHDHVLFDFRERHRCKNGRLGNKRSLLVPISSEEAVHLASLLFYLVEEHMRNSDEKPFYQVVTTPERAGLGPNWLVEDRDTAIPRFNRRRARSHVLGLMQRCLEVCEDEGFVKEVTMNLALWAQRSGDAFAAQKAEQALFQMDMVPAETRN